MSTARTRDTISECISQAQSGSNEAKERALQTLAKITKVSPLNRSLLAQADGAIPAFLRLTESNSPVVRALSLSILFNLSLNPDLKRPLADMETINRLNSIILSPSSPESSRLAASLVCSLAMLDKNKAKFGVAGTVQALIKAISGPNSAASHHLLSSLAELVQFHGNCTLAVRSGAVPMLLGLLVSTDGEDLAGTSLAILGLLARFNEGLNALIRTDKIVVSMTDVLKGRCMLSKEGAAEILVRLFDERSARAREKAGFLMRKMMEGDTYADGNQLLLQW
ncbi:hypothetical protein EUGRSUZ_C01784 [Eucalyptus grandis]|uniref:U-box domain-containing protein n=2 Tax=Eucalyptus grandis TaxID=71139 RepID=A0A059CPT1_EUCGR|nr:hypothetical protein EUGRSUZ_C01784 [Eucalyptus grandis]